MQALASQLSCNSCLTRASELRKLLRKLSLTNSYQLLFSFDGALCIFHLVLVSFVSIELPDPLGMPFARRLGRTVLTV
jgi:hypothetical protein